MKEAFLCIGVGAEFSLRFFPELRIHEEPGGSRPRGSSYFIKFGPSVEHAESISEDKFLLEVHIKCIFLGSTARTLLTSALHSFPFFCLRLTEPRNQNKLVCYPGLERVSVGPQVGLSNQSALQAPARGCWADRNKATITPLCSHAAGYTGGVLDLDHSP